MIGILQEAKRLYDLGFAIHWLRHKSKIPVEAAWTTGPRKNWKYLESTYQPGYNVGVRLGTPSQLKKGFLAVIDVDVKSTEQRHRDESTAAVAKLIQGVSLPLVRSGRGNGSRHYYCLTHEPFKTFNFASSSEKVKVLMPSKQKLSKDERETLTDVEIKKGIRLAHAWEVSLYSEGRQVVLPPSIHPDSGRAYLWRRPPEKIPILELDLKERPESPKLEPSELTAKDKIQFEFNVEPVELAWLPISDAVRKAILNGDGVSDRSGYLLKAASALVSAGLSQNEVLTVLTDPNTFLGECGYEHAQTTNRKRAAAWVHRYTLKKITAERSVGTIFSVQIPKPRKLTKQEIRDQAEEFAEDWDWKLDIVRDKQSGSPLKLVQNIVHILSNAVSPDLIQRDEFAYRDTFTVKTPWGAKRGALVSDDDVSQIQYWLGRFWRFEPPATLISNALVVLATKNVFDPVKHFLDTLPEWDKRHRLDTWLARHFEATGDAEYLAQVFRKWMVAMVMRVYHPGSKFDWMPIFEGAQGVGKSSFGRLLVGDKYFLDWLPNLQDKDSALSLQGMWGVEMGELSQFRRNELETIKAFITRTVDKMRPPYGRRLVESPRRCVFFGTTNRNTYLIDETGNRRFKPVEVGNLDFKNLKRDRLQLFAEAKYLFDREIENEMTFELTGDAKIFERKIHREKMVEDDSDSMKESMLDFVEKCSVEKIAFDLQKFKVLDLFEGVGPLGKWRPEIKNMMFAAKMLKKIGAKNRFIKGRKIWKIDAQK